ncbi:uncharacterized protein LOC122368785 [Amphibalanus amphitrite]|uniref:uncharacterized protein LOC122368785 n=1 Tax=Amphibalanus amphitrite TaxID=1232801 RepID=UPI001C905135|nr:uncharacterized protein LOC122368785 [Amphibalanus amphitrite]
MLFCLTLSGHRMADSVRRSYQRCVPAPPAERDPDQRPACGPSQCCRRGVAAVEGRETQVLVWRPPGTAEVSAMGATETAVGYRTTKRSSRTLEGVAGEGVTFLKRADGRTGSREGAVTGAAVGGAAAITNRVGDDDVGVSHDSDTVWMEPADGSIERTESVRKSGAGVVTSAAGVGSVAASRAVHPSMQLSVSFLERVPSIAEEPLPEPSEDQPGGVPGSGPSDADSSAVSEDSQLTAEPVKTDTLSPSPREPPESSAVTTTTGNHVTFVTPGSRRRAARPAPPLRQSSLLSCAKARPPAAQRPGVSHIDATSWPRPCEAPLLATVGGSSLTLPAVRQRFGEPGDQGLSVMQRPSTSAAIVTVPAPLSASSSGDSGVCSVSTQRLVPQSRSAASAAAEVSAGVDQRPDIACDCDCVDCSGQRTAPNSPPTPVSVPAVLVLVLAVGYLCLGAAALVWWEDWRFADGIFFCCVTLLTIGFGGRPPGALSPHPEPLLLFCCLYLTLGLAVVAMCFSLVQHQLVGRCRRLGDCLRLAVRGRRQQRARHRRGV